MSACVKTFAPGRILSLSNNLNTSDEDIKAVSQCDHYAKKKQVKMLCQSEMLRIVFREYTSQFFKNSTQCSVR